MPGATLLFTNSCGLSILDLGRATALQTYDVPAHALQGRFMTMGLFTTVSQWARIAALVGSIGAVLTAHWLYTSVTEGRKQRRYQRALEDVAKMK